jgi:rare lipoprotein A
MSGCGSAPRHDAVVERPPQVSRAPARAQAPAPAPSPRATRGGGYYLDDGPGESPPPDIDSIPEPVPQLEPLHRPAMRPYVVLGQNFTPMTELQPYRARGMASWYGRRYHGKQTSNGERYDMYAISAAHPTLPIPSYARVTNVASGKSVVVRINDRGPFLENRVIDLSYTAAHRLGVIGGGSALVDVETIIPDSSGTTVALAPRARLSPVKPAPAPGPRIQSGTAQIAIAGAGAGDPILAIAAAARDVDPTSALPAETPVPAAPAATETRQDSSGVYLQLGAFGSRENAESYLARARVQFDWLAERLQVRTREGLFRVHAGPYGSPVEARVAAERIASALGVKPVVTR